MTKSVNSQLSVKACASLDVSKDLEQPEGKSVAELLDEQEKDNEKETD